MDFIDKILPRSGFYCAARLLPTGGFSHKFFNNIPDLKKFLQVMDAAGHTMYLAQASFSPSRIIAAQEHNSKLPKGTPRSEYKGRRTQNNAMLLRNFFLDIDCGPEKFAKSPEQSYPTQMDGAKALKSFCDATRLPFPTLMTSGNGLYAHWTLDKDLEADRWKLVALALKKVTVEYDFKADPSRTADSASVLRPAGTHNRKNGSAKSVKVLRESPEISIDQFVETITAALKKKKVTLESLRTPVAYTGINDEFTSGIEGPPSSLLQIAEHCSQIRAVRDSQGDVAEPLWYNFIGVARFTAEGKEGVIIHEWSQGHSGYTAEATNNKIAHHAASGVGPTTCIKFASDNPTGCLACPHSNNIKSPVVLGRDAPKALEVTDDSVPAPPDYIRTEHGVFVKDDTPQGTKIYNYDIYPVKLAYDHSLGYETVTIRHNSFRNRGYKEFAVRASLVHDPKALLMALHDNHVQIQGTKTKGLMVAYLDQYMASLREKRDMASLCTQMGWHDKDDEKIFVLGEHIYQKNGETQTAGFAKNIPQVARAFAQKGSVDAWKKTTRFFGLPGMEPLAFAFLAGAFGSPLLQFTGFSGAMVALVGESGVGKTLTGEWIMSAFGDPEQLKLQNADTRNSLVARLGIYGSLPIYVDEVSNIEGPDLSDLLYRVTQGRDKARLNRSGVERENLNQWRTIALASSNHSLRDKLATLKADPSAELNRVLEINAYPVQTFLEKATAIRRVFCANHGTAGPIYVEYLAKHQDKHTAQIDKLIADINKKTGAKSDERFWSAIAGVAMYGGLIAQKLGLIEFDVMKVYAWLTQTIKESRDNKHDLVVESTDLIGQYLDDRSTCGLFTTGNDGKLMVSILREPRGPLEFRVDLDTHRLYISRTSLRSWLNKKFGSYSDLRDSLTRNRVLISTDSRKVLGCNTYIGGTQVPCWVLDLKNPALGRQAMMIVKRETDDTPQKEMI